VNNNLHVPWIKPAMITSKQTRIILVVSLLGLSIPTFSADRLAAETNERSMGKVPIKEISIDAATLREGNQDFDQAIDLYEDLIEAIQKIDGTFSHQLIDPLLGLARSHFERQEYETTIDYLAQAQHIVHRFEGVYSTRQKEGINLLIKTHLEMGEVGLANKQQFFKLFIAEHNVGKDSVGLLTALEHINRWYIETGQFNRAKKSLLRSQEIIISEGGEFDPRQLDILSTLSKVRRLNRFCCSDKILEKGLSILEANPNLAKTKQAAFYLALGDAYTLSSKYEPAQTYYAKAWEFTGANTRTAVFDKPMGIEFAKEIGSSRSPNSKTFLVAHDRFGPRRFEEVSRQEKRILETLTPQDFQFSTQADSPNYRIRDLNAGASIQGKKEIRTTGYPFMFNREQLKQILPFRFHTDEALKSLKVEMEFTVSAKGDTKQVRIITSGLPNKLSRLMRDVLNRSHFRPRIVDGIPVSTTGVSFTQIFE